METQDWIAIGTIASAIVAFVALLRPEITNLYRRRSGRVSIYQVRSSAIIGYSTFGPFVGFSLLFRARDREFFVLASRASVTRVRDGARCKLEWMVIQPVSFGLVTMENTQVAMPFRLNRDAAQPLYVVFSESRRAEENEEVLRGLREAWFEIFKRLDLPLDLEAAVPDGGPGAKERILEDFIKKDEVLSDWEKLKRLNFWEAGDYKVSIDLETAEPNQVFGVSGEFSLSEEQSEILSGNAMSMLRQIAYPETVLPTVEVKVDLEP